MFKASSEYASMHLHIIKIIFKAIVNVFMHDAHTRKI